MSETLSSHNSKSQLCLRLILSHNSKKILNLETCNYVQDTIKIKPYFWGQIMSEKLSKSQTLFQCTTMTKTHSKSPFKDKLIKHIYV